MERDHCQNPCLSVIATREWNVPVQIEVQISPDEVTNADCDAPLTNRLFELIDMKFLLLSLIQHLTSHCSLFHVLWLSFTLWYDLSEVKLLSPRPSHCVPTTPVPCQQGCPFTPSPRH